MKTETKVGLFVIISLVLLFVLTMQISKYQNIGKDGYTISTLVDNVSGLELRSKVKVNGLEAGYLENMQFVNNQIKLDLFIYKSINLPIDSTLKFTQDSLLGGKSILITKGTNKQYLKPKQSIKANIDNTSFADTSTSVNDAAQEFRVLIKKFNTLMDANSISSLKSTMNNIEQLSSSLNNAIDQNKLTQLLNNLNTLTKNISASSKQFGNMSSRFTHTADIINQDLPSLLSELKQTIRTFKNTSTTINEQLPQITSNINEILQENKKPLNETIKSAGDFFATGANTLGVVDEYIDKLSQTKLEVALESHYMTKDQFNESSFLLNYITNPTRYYMFQLTSTADYSNSDSNGSVIEPDIHDKSKFLISAQMGKRYKDYMFRAGLIKSTGGVGMDYYSHKDKLQSSIQMYDFNSQNDLRSKRATLDIGWRYEVAKYIDAYAGVKNVLNSNRNAYIGLGIRFVDEDLKTLMGSIGGLSNLAK